MEISYLSSSKFLWLSLTHQPFASTKMVPRGMIRVGLATDWLLKIVKVVQKWKRKHFERL